MQKKNTRSALYLILEKAHLTKQITSASCYEYSVNDYFSVFTGDEDEEELPKPSEAAAKVEETLLNLKDTNTTTDLLS